MESLGSYVEYLVLRDGEKESYSGGSSSLLMRY